MTDAMEISGMLVVPFVHEREINYIVTRGGDYVCRLVPGYAGFELSPLDRAVGTEIPAALLTQLNEFIITRDA